MTSNKYVPIEERVREFLSKPRRDLERAKRFSAKKVYASLPKDAEFVYKPYKHQAVCFLLCLRLGSLFIQANMGLGKTKVMLDVFRYRIKKGVAKRMLVLVPYSANVPTWRAEVEKHTPEFDVLECNARLKSKFEACSDVEGPPIVVVTYAGLLSMLRSKTPSQVRKFAKGFDTLVCDESAAFKNPTSKTFKLLRKMAEHIQHRYCLSGTPFSVSPINLWSQFYVCDFGETLHPQFGVFRYSLFEQKAKYIGHEWVLPKENEARLTRICRHGAIRYSDEDCADLPELIGGIDNPEFLWVDQTKEQRDASQGMISDLKMRLAMKDNEGINSVYYRARAICAGYLPLENGDVVHFSENPKLEMLMSCLEELAGEKAIVFFHYGQTGELIKAALKRARITFAEIHGKVRDKGKALSDFMNKKQVLLGSEAAAVGLNLQFCSNTFYFETTDKIDARKQGEKRTHRDGQKSDRVRIFDIVVRGSIEEKVYFALQHRKRVLDVVLDGAVK